MLGRAIALVAALPALLHAQSGNGRGTVDVRPEIFVGSEVEEYLRYLQTLGRAGAYPWSIRGFSAAELDRILPRSYAHPWAERYLLRPDSAHGLRVREIRPRSETTYNSAFPYGSNDGPVWAGRGLTSAAQLGFAARYGALSLSVAPLWFRAQNESFALPPNGHSDRLRFADGLWPTFIDLPRRFGDRPYARLDPGQSTLRVDLPLVAAGVSTANQWWGPATRHPLVLGNNAAGFPHGFIGSSRPVNVGIGRAHGRLVWGSLSQSAYSPIPADSAGSRRLMSGAVVTFTPRGMKGLEIGGTRFFHEAWPAEGLTLGDLSAPFDALLKAYLADRDTASSDKKSDANNQIASVFFRWVFAGSGAEVYGEFAKEDHNWNFRDFVLEPDHASAYTLGIRKVWPRSESGMVALRGEVMNAEPSHLLRVRLASPFYRHTLTRQGHTNRGQALGSAAAYGGAGSSLALDYFGRRGGWTAEWTRTVQANGVRELDRNILPEAAGWDDPDMYDVLQGLELRGLLFHGRWDVGAGLGAIYNFNRNFAGDAFNLNAHLFLRAKL